MKEEQKASISLVLFWTFWVLFVLSALGTLAMLFLGFGAVQDSERPLLISAFLVETAVAIGALFYSLFSLRHTGIGKEVDKNSATSEEDDQSLSLSDRSIGMSGLGNVVIYMPLLHLNPFFSTFLELLCHKAQKSGVNVIIKTGHNNNREVDWSVVSFLREINDSDLQDAAIVIFPPHPEAYIELLDRYLVQEFQNLNVIMMDVDPLDGVDDPGKRMQCVSAAEYIKAIIILDNDEVCTEAAKAVIGAVEGKSDDINILLCDGNYHSRAALFHGAMNELSKKAKKLDGQPTGIRAAYLPEEEVSKSYNKINFSTALNDSYHYVSTVLSGLIDKVATCPTFIFCANDVIALGAREALDSFSSSKLEKTFIIAYDASDLLESYMSANDPYIGMLLGQNYGEYTTVLIEEIETILVGKGGSNKKRSQKIRRIKAETIRCSNRMIKTYNKLGPNPHPI